MDWNFPLTNGGQIRGIADAGIETFNGKELKSLAREICQNSLDAQEDENKPVYVEFFRHSVSTKDIPGYERYKDILDKGNKYWTSVHNKKAMAFLDFATKEINRYACGVLRISDSNTKGLSDPYKETLEGWNSLVKLDGGATKSGDSAGSFGIGKNAPFCCSHFRLVFYRTLNQDNENACQGVSRLLSYPEDLKQPISSMANGIGYFGDEERNMPVKKIDEIEKINQRTEHGTDVFVYGFKYGSENWEDELITAILDNFLVAIYKGQLEVKIQKNDTITSKNLGSYLEKYKSKVKDAYGEYQALKGKVDDKKYFEFEKDFHNMGQLYLKVLIDPREKLNRRVLVVRKAGMLLFRKTGISKSICFTAILELKGKKLNEYFGSMETPSHDKWQPTRHEENIQEAKQYYDELYEWVSSTIYNLADVTDSGEINVEGLGNILKEHQDSVDDSTDENKNESLNNLLGKLEVIERKKATQVTGMLYRENGESTKTERVTGTLGRDGDDAVRTLKGKKKRKKKTPHRGIPDPNGKDIVNIKTINPTGGAQNVELEDVRIIKTGMNTYVVSFVVPDDVYSGHIEITTIGENNRSSLLNVVKAKAVNGISGLEIIDSTIEFKDIKAENKVKFEFVLSKSYNYAMEVDVYEHI